MSMRHGISLVELLPRKVNTDVQIPIKMVNILPREDMETIFTTQLKGHKWKQKKKGLELRLEDDYLVRISDQNAKATIWRQVVGIENPDEELLKKNTKLAQTAITKVLADTYKEALLSRARMLGDVESIQESATVLGTRISITVRGS